MDLRPGRDLGSEQERIEELRPQDAVSDRTGLRPQEGRDSLRLIGASAPGGTRRFRIDWGFGLTRDGTVPDRSGLRLQERWDGSELIEASASGGEGHPGQGGRLPRPGTGVTLLLWSKPREGETTVKLPRGFARSDMRITTACQNAQNQIARRSSLRSLSASLPDIRPFASLASRPLTTFAARRHSSDAC